MLVSESSRTASGGLLSGEGCRGVGGLLSDNEDDGLGYEEDREER